MPKKVKSVKNLKKKSLEKHFFLNMHGYIRPDLNIEPLGTFKIPENITLVLHRKLGIPYELKTDKELTSIYSSICKNIRNSKIKKSEHREGDEFPNILLNVDDGNKFRSGVFECKNEKVDWDYFLRNSVIFDFDHEFPKLTHKNDVLVSALQKEEIREQLDLHPQFVKDIISGKIKAGDEFLYNITLKDVIERIKQKFPNIKLTLHLITCTTSHWLAEEYISTFNKKYNWIESEPEHESSLSSTSSEDLEPRNESEIVKKNKKNKKTQKAQKRKKYKNKTHLRFK